MLVVFNARMEYIYYMAVVAGAMRWACRALEKFASSTQSYVICAGVVYLSLECLNAVRRHDRVRRISEEASVDEDRPEFGKERRVRVCRRPDGVRRTSRSHSQVLDRTGSRWVCKREDLLAARAGIRRKEKRRRGEDDQGSQDWRNRSGAAQREDC